MPDELTAVLAAVGGYALGTLQVLLVDWVRRRRGHKARLRTLRAEVERTLTLSHRFKWDGGIEEDLIPKPPIVSPAYADLVTSIEFYLTDEFQGDNAQQVFLSVLDGIDILADTHRQIRERIALLPELRDKDRVDRLERVQRELLQLAASYDERLGRFEATLKSGVQDIERRLKEARYPRQIVREVQGWFGGLPEGENPEPLRRGDLRQVGNGEDTAA